MSHLILAGVFWEQRVAGGLKREKQQQKKSSHWIWHFSKVTAVWGTAMSRQWLPFQCIDLATLAQQFPELTALIIFYLEGIWNRNNKHTKSKFSCPKRLAEEKNPVTLQTKNNGHSLNRKWNMPLLRSKTNSRFGFFILTTKELR